MELTRLQRALVVPLAVCAMVIGSLVGGVLIAFLAQLGQVLPREVTMYAAIAVCVWALAVDAIGGSPPSRHWLVPRNWGGWRWPLFHMTFGAILGIGWLTIVPFASFYALIAVLIALGSAKVAVGTMAIFGIARSVPLVLLSAGILQGASPVGFGRRSAERRNLIYMVANSRAMWSVRVLGELGAVAMLLLRV